MAKSRDTGELCMEQEGTWQCPRRWAGEGIPPQCLTKRPFARFLVYSQRFIPYAEFLKGVRRWHLGKKKGLRAGCSPALPWDVTCERWECILGLTQEGDKVLVLLSGSLGTLDHVICSRQRLLLPTARFLTRQPRPASWGGKSHLQPLWQHRTRWTLLQDV